MSVWLRRFGFTLAFLGGASILPATVAAGTLGIGVYEEPNGFDCNISQAQFNPGTLYVLATVLPGGITSAEFRIDGLPSDWFGSFSPNPQASSSSGNPLFGGCRINFSNCQFGSNGVVLLGTISYFATSFLTNRHLVVSQHTTPSNPSFQCPNLTACDASTAYCVCGGQAVINGSFPEPCLPTAGLISRYRDADSDGYGDPSVSISHCGGSSIPGYVDDTSDCDDSRPSVSPGAPEICDALDNNCNGQVDEVAHAPGLVGWWPGNGNADDATGTYDGTAGGTATYSSGQVGQAFAFDGAGYVGNIGTTGSFSFIENTGVFTIEAWIKLNDPTAPVQEAVTANTSTSNEKGHFFIWENSAGEQRLRLGLMKAIVGVPIIEAASPTHVITTNDWHHVAAVGDGTMIMFYVDGAGYPGSGVMGAKPSGSSTRAVNIGRCPSASPECQFKGKIDELAIYNRALGASEIQAIHAAGSGGRCALLAVDDPPPSASFEFAAPWPNPAERVMHFEFQLPARAAVFAEVVDVAGRRVSPLLKDAVLPAGTNRLQWDGRDAAGRRVAPGVYLVRISTGAAAAVRRIVVIH